MLEAEQKRSIYICFCPHEPCWWATHETCEHVCACKPITSYLKWRPMRERLRVYLFASIHQCNQARPFFCINVQGFKYQFQCTKTVHYTAWCCKHVVDSRLIGNVPIPTILQNSQKRTYNKLLFLFTQMIIYRARVLITKEQFLHIQFHMYGFSRDRVLHL